MKRSIAAVLTFLIFSCQIAYADTLRIGFITKDVESGCFIGDAIPTEDGRMYADHLQKRFSDAISLCFSPSADGFAGREPDIIWGLRTELEAFDGRYRPFLTKRSSASLGRVPIVFFERNAASSTGAERFRGKRLAYSAKEPAALNKEMALALLSDLGVDLAEITLVPAPDSSSVADLVRGGDADFGTLEISSWSRNCAVYRSDQKGCSDLSIVFTSRPRADVGMIIRRDISKEIRYRMVGVHAHMHYEEPRASSWVLGDREARFEPLEPEAFTIGTAAGGR